MTSNLLPIPPESRVGKSIRKMEVALRALREAAIKEGVADIFQVHDSSSNGTSFADLKTTGEGNYEWQEFYHYYDLNLRSSNRNWNRDENTYSGTSSGPQWVKFHTEDRLEWVRAVPALLESLRGLPVSVSKSTSWRWDYDNRRPNGRPHYIHQYELMVSMSEDTKEFVPESITAQLLQQVCHSSHPLADEHLFEWQEEHLGKLLFGCYGWTPEGVNVTFHNKELMQSAMTSIFQNMEHTVTKTGRGRGTNWHVQVTFPDSTPEVTTA